MPSGDQSKRSLYRKLSLQTQVALLIGPCDLADPMILKVSMENIDILWSCL